MQIFISKVSPLHSPVHVSLIPGTPSPSSSNSSSRESTIKRSSSKDIPASPSIEQQPAVVREVPKPVDVDIQKVVKVEEKEKLKPLLSPASPADTVSEVLQKGKVWSKKGKQVSIFWKQLYLNSHKKPEILA